MAMGLMDGFVSRSTVAAWPVAVGVGWLLAVGTPAPANTGAASAAGPATTQPHSSTQPEALSQPASTQPVSASTQPASTTQPVTAAWPPKAGKELPRVLTRIAVGSCCKQDQPQPIWPAIIDVKPDMFIFTGDNIYGDSDDPAVLKRKYQTLLAEPNFARLRDSAAVVGTWDDHDYGRNDAGSEFPVKQASQALLLDFFSVPADSPRRVRDGVYDSMIIGEPGQQVQILLLDTRYHRGPLQRHAVRPRPRGPYKPSDDPAVTMLGDEQWAWLKAELSKPADVRILVSSIQVLPEEHGFEGWYTMPQQRERLFQTIREANASGVVIVSGDRHLSEISESADMLPYPVVELTSSALNQRSGSRPDSPEPNKHRVGDQYYQSSFGMLELDWTAQPPTITLRICDVEGKSVHAVAKPLSDLKMPAKP